MTKEELRNLQLDMMCGYKYIRDNYCKIIEIPPTPEELARRAKEERKEKIEDFLTHFYAITGLGFCIAAPCAMSTSVWGALLFIPALLCTWGLKNLCDKA